MIEMEDLKRINLLKPLDDEKLKRLQNVTSLESVRKGDFFYHSEDPADKLYAILSGRVGLAVAKSAKGKQSHQHTWVVELGPANCFGVSAAIFTPERTHMTCAKALSEVKALSWKSNDLQSLLEQNFEMGYWFMSELARAIKDRLKVKNIQYLDIYR